MTGDSEKDPKDRLGDKLRDKEKAQEDRYFAEKEKELLRRMKEKLESASGDRTESPAGRPDEGDGREAGAGSGERPGAAPGSRGDGGGASGDEES